MNSVRFRPDGLAASVALSPNVALGTKVKTQDVVNRANDRTKSVPTSINVSARTDDNRMSINAIRNRNGAFIKDIMAARYSKGGLNLSLNTSNQTFNGNPAGTSDSFKGSFDRKKWGVEAAINRRNNASSLGAHIGARYSPDFGGAFTAGVSTAGPPGVGRVSPMSLNGDGEWVENTSPINKNRAPTKVKNRSTSPYFQIKYEQRF
jgi:hypothetical protein